MNRRIAACVFAACVFADKTRPIREDASGVLGIIIRY
jgi:hypothetical protein